MKSTVSVIVATYNNETTIVNCLDSVLRASKLLSHLVLELIIINDGSTDRTDENISSWLRSIDGSSLFVRLVSQKNSGLGASRNRGIQLSGGEYCMFLDADDSWCWQNFQEFEQRVMLCRNFDALMFDFSTQSSDVSSNKLQDSAVGQSGGVKLLHGPPALWRYLFRKSFLESNDIRFSMVRFAEDLCFFAQFFALQPKVLTERLVIYRYNIDNSSALTRGRDGRWLLQAQELIHATMILKYSKVFSNIDIGHFFLRHAYFGFSRSPLKLRMKYLVVLFFGAIKIILKLNQYPS
jgi:glycosyltransferase involved in cell wall biosynthesis